jgi:hypothetical protein
MHTLFRPLAAGLLLAALLSDSPAAPAARPAALLRAKTEAAAALAGGNPAQALASLRAASSRGRLAPSEDAQVIAALCSLAREMEASAPGRGRSAAGLALAEGRRNRAGLNARDAALTDLALGELNEVTLGDHETARGHYQSALASGATSAAARRGLDRLAWRQAQVDALNAGNESIRRRTS